MPYFVAALLLVVESAAVWLTARRIAVVLVGDDGAALHRAFVGVVVATVEITAIMQILGMVGVLSRVPVAIAHVALALAVLRVTRPLDRDPHRQPPSRAIVAVGAVSLALAATALTLGLRGPSHENDTVHYHTPTGAGWLQTHSLWRLPFGDPGFYTNAYPSNGELAGLWVMLPSHSDELAYITNVWFGALAVLGTTVLAAELGGSVAAGASAGLAVVAAPICWSQAHSMMTDLNVAGGVVGAVALLLIARRRPGLRRWPLLAGLCLGLAAGSKYSALLPAAVVAAAAVVLLGRREWRGIVVLLAGAAALSAFWFVRNSVVLGNPLYPQEINGPGGTILAGGHGGLTDLGTSLLTHIAHGNSEVVRLMAHIVRVVLGPVAVLFALGVAGAAFRGFRERRVELFVVGVLGIGLVIAYAATPTTGGGPAAIPFLIGSNFRYVVPALFVAAAAAAASWPKIATVVAVAAMAYGFRHIVSGPLNRPDAVPDATTLVIVAATLAVYAVAVAVTRHIGGRDSSATPLWARIGPWLVAWAALAGVLATSGVPVRDEILGLGLRRANRPHGDVAALGVLDVRRLMGPSFERQVKPVGRGRHAELIIASAYELDAKVRGVTASVLAVGHSSLSEPPRGWNPPLPWSFVGERGHVRFYMRQQR